MNFEKQASIELTLIGTCAPVLSFTNTDTLDQVELSWAELNSTEAV